VLLELGRAITFFLSIASLLAVAKNTFFLESLRWSDRLPAMLLHLVVAACICFGSGLLFAYPTERGLMRTPPVRMFLWALALVPVLFFVGWYLNCGNPLRPQFGLACG
jgi:hypothetical protein